MADKLKRIEVEEKLKNIGALVFTPAEFSGFLNVPIKTATNFISTNIGNSGTGLFIKLRNGLYVVKDAYVSSLYIANKVYEPSYVSLNTALSHYGIIPEVVYATTSVTTKVTREFTTPKGNFIYQRIKKQAFTGYGLEFIDKENVLIAEPEKALADYLYFVDLKRVSLNDRLELKNIRKSELIKFAKLFERKSLIKLVDHIYAEYKKPRKIY
jgi:predicted transcriptional regulator of viral defense system